MDASLKCCTLKTTKQTISQPYNKHMCQQMCTVEKLRNEWNSMLDYATYF